MDIHKQNGDRYFVSTPENQIELELLLNRLDLISSIGKSVRHHRTEVTRLENQLQGVEQEPVYAPEGYVFGVRSKQGFRKEHFHISRYIPGKDRHWTSTREEEFDRGVTFIAVSIGAESTFQGDESGSVYAYGLDETRNRIRCRLDPGQYDISLTASDSIPEHLVNPQPSIESLVQA